MKFKLIVDPNQEEQIVATVHERSALTAKIEEMVLSHNGADRIAVYTEDEMRLLRFRDMECISVTDGKTYAIDANGKAHRIRLRLYEVEAMLPDYFIRINKSALANEYRIERFSASLSGAVDAVFRSGHKEYVSRRCFSQIKRRFDKK